MKAVLQDMKSGELTLAEVPPPALQPGGILVRVTRSVISLGTERSVIALARKGPIGKARDRPDLVRKVMNRARQEGVRNTYNVVRNLLSSPIPLGYSCAGRVLAAGAETPEFRVGDRVACAGLGYANHAEIDYVPRNLATHIPDEVPDESAAFVAIGAIAIHGVRLASLSLGESVLVIGLGLVGQIGAQLARAAGATVFGYDPDPEKAALAERLGTHFVSTKAVDLLPRIRAITGGSGVDAVLICAASKSDAPIRLAAEAARLRACVIVVGDVPMNLERRPFFEKEIEVKVSRSYGPGRYDAAYELRGVDYPLPYVRWTERRNMSAFMDLLAKGAIDVEPLVTHRYPIADAERAYGIVTGGEVKKAMAIVLEYPDAVGTYDVRVPLKAAQRGATPAPVRLGVIGAGQFAKGILLPEFQKQKQVQVIGLCTASGLTSRNAGERYGAEYCTSDASQIMSDERITAVVIATRHDQHASLIASAIQAGKAVFCEKPLASTREGLAEVAAAIAAALSPRLMVGFNRRFSPLAQKCKAFIREGNAPQSILYRVNAGSVPSDSWVLDPVSGGGRIVGEVGHFIDFACFLTDSLPVRIFAEQVAIAGESVADRESVSIIMNLTDGSVATIQYTSSGDPSVPKERVEVASASRMAILDNFRSLSLHSNNARRRHRLLNQSKGHKEEVAAFVGALTGGTRMPVDIETVLAVARATFAIEESLALRAPVET